MVLLYAFIYIFLTAEAKETELTETTSLITTNQEPTTEATTESLTHSISTTAVQTTECITIITTVDNDVYLLAQLIHAEAGDECSDEHKLYVGQVVLNRVKHPDFPDTIQGVIYQNGQYHCVTNGAINNIPSERSLKAAKALINGFTVNEEVIWQSEFPQGEVVEIFDTGYSTTYIGK